MLASSFVSNDHLCHWARRGCNATNPSATRWNGSELRCTINIVECLDLEELAATARRLNRYEFVITFAPLPVEGGNGSLVNPLVTFPARVSDLPRGGSPRPTGAEATATSSKAAPAKSGTDLPELA